MSTAGTIHDIRPEKTMRVADGERTYGTTLVKRGFAHMLKRGVIIDVTSVVQAQIAEDAGAVAVMVLEHLPVDIRSSGNVARSASVDAIEAIKDQVSIPIMAKCRIGHHAEARVLEEIGIDMVDESEVLTPADETHIWKWGFRVPFVNGSRSLGEALRRIEEGASMIRTKGEPGTGNVAEAVAHMGIVKKEMSEVRGLYLDGNESELMQVARRLNSPYSLVCETGRLGRMPVVNFAAGGVATPADAALMMSLGCDGVFVGSGVFKSHDPEARARSIVLATSFFGDGRIVTEAQAMVKESSSMKGTGSATLPVMMQERGTS